MKEEGALARLSIHWRLKVPKSDGSRASFQKPISTTRVSVPPTRRILPVLTAFEDQVRTTCAERRARVIRSRPPIHQRTAPSPHDTLRRHQRMETFSSCSLVNLTRSAAAPAQLFPAVGRTRTHTHSDIFAGASAVVGRKKKRPFYLRVDKELQSLLQLIPKATFTMIVFVCFLGGGGGLPPNFLFFFLTSANMLSPVYVFYSHIFNICFILLSYF